MLDALFWLVGIFVGEILTSSALWKNFRRLPTFDPVTFGCKLIFSFLVRVTLLVAVGGLFLMKNCSNFFFSCSGIIILVFIVFFFCTGTFLGGGGAFRINFVVLGLVGGRGTCLFSSTSSPGPPLIRVVSEFFRSQDGFSALVGGRQVVGGGAVIVTSSAGSDICRLLLASLMHSSASSIQNILV